MKPLTQHDIEATVANRAREMRAAAHVPGNEVDITKGQTVQSRFPPRPDSAQPHGLLTHKERLPGWETKIILNYSVDIVPDDRVPLTPPPTRRLRHLSIQISVPGQITQGELTASMTTRIEPNTPTMLELLEPIVRVFFPLHGHVRHAARALPPIPVQDVSSAGRGNVHFRTPVVFHFVVDDNDETAIAGVSDRRRWN